MNKRFLNIVGNLIPAVISGEPSAPTPVTLPSGRTKMTQFVWVISLRQNLAGETYLTQSFEDMTFLPPRNTNVIGLDSDEEGTLLDVGDLGLLIAENQAARQLSQQAARPAAGGAVIADVG